MIEVKKYQFSITVTDPEPFLKIKSLARSKMVLIGKIVNEAFDLYIKENEKEKEKEGRVKDWDGNYIGEKNCEEKKE